MPVLVTAADTPLGLHLVQRLAATGGQVRGYCSAGGDVAAVRRAGAIAAVGDRDDEGRLEAACAQVHTVVHLGGGLLSRSGAQVVADAVTVATAADNAGVQRLVMLSVLGARAGAPDELRRAKHEAERVLAEAAAPSVVVRTGLVEAGALAEVLAGTPLPPDLRDHQVDVMDAGHLVDLLVQFDELRSSSSRGHAVFVAPGRQVRLGDVVDRADQGHGVYRPADSVPLLLPALAGPWVDRDPIAADAWEFTGVERVA